MTQLEKDLLIIMHNSLSDSIEPGWDNGNLDNWTAWAMKMRSTIKTTCATIEAIIKQPIEEVVKRPVERAIPQPIEHVLTQPIVESVAQSVLEPIVEPDEIMDSAENIK
jgi:hypothetical protein